MPISRALKRIANAKDAITMKTYLGTGTHSDMSATRKIARKGLSIVNNSTHTSDAKVDSISEFLAGPAGPAPIVSAMASTSTNSYAKTERTAAMTSLTSSSVSLAEIGMLTVLRPMSAAFG